MGMGGLHGQAQDFSQHEKPLKKLQNKTEGKLNRHTPPMEVLMTKCPKCNLVITTLTVEALDLIDSAGGAWKGVIYGCPYCFHAISAGIDPLAQKEHIVTDIVRALRGG